MVVLIMDLSVPLGIATGVLYLFCLFLVCRQSKKVILTFATVTSLLTVFKFLVFFSSETNFIAYTNRALTLIIVWIVALLAIRHRNLVEVINSERNIYIRELEEMLFMTSHRVRKPLSTCMGLLQLADDGKSLTMDECLTIFDHLKTGAIELDKLTKELSAFIYDIGRKDKKNSHIISVLKQSN